MVTPVVIGIGGASSSGKTTLATLLHSILSQTILLHEDDFYKNDNDIPIDPKTGEANWDLPEALNFSAFKSEVQYIRQHGSLSPEVESYEIRYNSGNATVGKEWSIPGELSNEIRIRLSNVLKELNLKIIFVEGFMLYHDPEIINLFDIKIFLRASYDSLKARREKRSGYKTQETFWIDPPNYFDDIVYPAYFNSHKHLFLNEDVENDLKEDLVRKYNLFAFENNNGTDIMQVLKWAADTLENELISKYKIIDRST